MRDFTMEQLAQHDGSNPDLPMLISIRGVVFDVSTGKQFYGPNGEQQPQQLLCVDFTRARNDRGRQQPKCRLSPEQPWHYL